MKGTVTAAEKGKGREAKMMLEKGAGHGLLAAQTSCAELLLGVVC